MEKLKDIFEGVKERVSNPFIFSFLCAWIAYNWEIVVALVYYDASSWQVDKCENIFQFVNIKLDKDNSFKYPLMVAIGYTILMPVLKNLIKILNSFLEQKADNIILHVNKNGKVPIAKYVLIQQRYINQQKTLQDVIDSEEVTKNQLDRETNRLKDMQQTLESLYLDKRAKEEEINKMQYSLNVSFLNGSWTNKYASKYPLFNDEENIVIKDGKYFIEDSDGKQVHLFNIVNFHFDERTKKVRFVKDLINQSSAYVYNGSVASLKYKYNELSLRSDDSMDGFENGSVTVKYTKR